VPDNVPKNAPPTDSVAPVAEDESGERESRIYSAPFRIAGSRGSSISLPDIREDFDSIRPVANVLMGAAHSDGKFCEREQQAVRGVLCQLLGVEVLPEEIERLVSEFDPARFDLRSAVDDLTRQSRASEERTLQLVRKVCEADARIDINEDDYMVALALALSLSPARYKKLVVAESRGVNGFWKRAEDLVIGTLLVAVCLVPMLLIAIGIKLDSPGPIFFRQRRYGRGGKEIDVLKFRSMTVCEDNDSIVQAQRNDPRVTRFGAFIRRTSLDELPQLFNVFLGSMSLVGPRPHAVAHNELYRSKIQGYMLRHKVKPGITGWAQVNGWRGETDTLRKMVYRVEHDLEYIRNWSLWLDFKILLLTAFGRRVWRNAY